MTSRLQPGEYRSSVTDGRRMTTAMDAKGKTHMISENVDDAGNPVNATALDSWLQKFTAGSLPNSSATQNMRDVTEPARPSTQQRNLASPDVMPPEPLPRTERELIPVADRTVTRAPFAAPNQAMPTPQTTEVSGRETVAGNLRELLASDSPYLEQGRQEGLKFASQRGLQNSTMAMQAGEQARISAALPIAQQDASTYADRATLNQNTINQFRLSEMDHLQSMVEMAQQGNINAQLQLDQFGFNSALSAQENVEQMERMALAGDIEARQRYIDFNYSTIMAGIQQGYALELNDQSFQQSQQLLAQEFANALGLSAQQSQQELERLNQGHVNTLEEIERRSELARDEQRALTGQQLQAQYLAQVAARQQAASEEIRIIMQTEGLSASQQQAGVSAASRRMQADIEALQAYYAKSPQWDDDFGAEAVGTDPVITPPPSPPGTLPPGDGFDGRYRRDFR